MNNIEYHIEYHTEYHTEYHIEYRNIDEKMDTEENIYVNDSECGICYERFINIKGVDFELFLETHKPTLINENDIGYVYDERFECLICKNKCCRGCVWNFTGLKKNPSDDDDTDDDYYEIDDDGYIRGIQGEDGPITCPFCRTNDYREYYREYYHYPRYCKMPEELLYAIKSRRRY